MSLAIALAAVVGACAEGDGGPDGPPVAIGVPVTAAQLWAAGPHGGAALVLERVRRRGMDRRDVCFRLSLARERHPRASVRCAVRDPRGGIVELPSAKGVVAGHAGPSVRKLLLEVGDQSLELPISADRGFLARLPASSDRRVALVARRADGTVATKTVAPRRAGAVFDGEIGKRVVGERERHLVRRLGPPQDRRNGCLRYTVVGRPGGAWTLCLERGRVARAWAEWR